MGFKGGSLSKLNAFPRAEEHLMKKTSSGAAVTIIGLLLMATLFLHELRYQLSIRTVHEMSVETKRGEKLPIVVNITFPALPCKVLSLDAIDMSGKHEVDLDTNIWKIRVNKDGYILGSEFISDLVEGEHKSEEFKADAHAEADGNDHEDRHHGDDEHDHYHGPKSIGDPQKVIQEIKTALEQQEGCRVFGVLDVERVAGNFHVSMHGLSIFVAQQVYESVTAVNVSHVIHDLSFGPKYPGIHNPLDGTKRILHEESGTFKYFLKVVPTEYKFLSGLVMPTNQFSVTEYFMSSKVFDRNWPGTVFFALNPVHQVGDVLYLFITTRFRGVYGHICHGQAVFFVYDLSPISVTIREERHHFGHFLTRICAVLGGTFAVTGMLDRWIFSLVEIVTASKKGKGVMR